MVDNIIYEPRAIVTRGDANASGLREYFTGIPCKRGHVAARRVSQRQCVECARIYCLRWRALHPERAKESQREFRKRNLEKCREGEARWRGKNPEKMRKKGAKWRTENPERERENIARWNSENPVSVRAMASRRRARKAGAEGTYTASDIVDIMMRQKGKCAHAWCRKALVADYHIDHVIPLALGGSNWPTNLQLLCPPCNCSKKDKHPIDYAKQHGLLL